MEKTRYGVEWISRFAVDANGEMIPDAHEYSCRHFDTLEQAEACAETLTPDGIGCVRIHRDVQTRINGGWMWDRDDSFEMIEIDRPIRA